MRESSVGYVDRRCILCLASLFTSCIVSFDMWKFKFLIIDEFMDFFPLWFVNFASSLRNYDYHMNSQLFQHHPLSLSFFPQRFVLKHLTYFMVQYPYESGSKLSILLNLLICLFKFVTVES